MPDILRIWKLRLYISYYDLVSNIKPPITSGHPCLQEEDHCSFRQYVPKLPTL